MVLIFFLNSNQKPKLVKSSKNNTQKSLLKRNCLKKRSFVLNNQCEKWDIPDQHSSYDLQLEESILDYWILYPELPSSPAF